MTKNRARIRAAKALAKAADIRHPDASYLADNRRLRLADGTIHDFTTGPLQLTGDGTASARSQAETIRIRAAEKKWRVAQVGAGAPTPGILDFAREKPCLVVIHSDGTAPANTLAADMAAGAYPDLNIVVVAESCSPIFLGEFRSGAPAPAVNIITGGPGSGRNAGIRAQIEAADAAREALIALGIPQAQRMHNVRLAMWPIRCRPNLST